MKIDILKDFQRDEALFCMLECCSPHISRHHRPRVKTPGTALPVFFITNQERQGRVCHTTSQSIKSCSKLNSYIAIQFT